MIYYVRGFGMLHYMIKFFQCHKNVEDNPRNPSLYYSEGVNRNVSDRKRHVSGIEKGG